MGTGSTAVTIFCVIVAAVIAITRIILGILKDRDEAKGMMIDPDEYRMGGLIRIMAKERWTEFRDWIRRIRQKHAQRKDRRSGTSV